MPLIDDDTPLTRQQQVHALQREIRQLEAQLATLNASGPLVRVAHLWSVRDRRGRLVLRCHLGPVRLVVIPHDLPMANGSTHAVYLGAVNPSRLEPDDAA